MANQFFLVENQQNTVYGDVKNNFPSANYKRKCNTIADMIQINTLKRSEAENDQVVKYTRTKSSQIPSKIINPDGKPSES